MNNSSGHVVQSAELLLSSELGRFCESELLTEEGLREIIQRHGLAHDEHLSDYYFFRAACSNRRVTEEMIQCLLEYFPDAASTTDDHGWKPLHIACWNKNVTPNIIQLLLDAAPASVRSVTNVTDGGWTPLHYLCSNDKVDEGNAIQILKLLIEKYPEAARHATYGQGRLPIHRAAAGRSPEFCRELIEAYPGSERINDANGLLPLHCACTRNTLPTVEYFYKLYPAAIHRVTTGDYPSGGYYPIHKAISFIAHRDDPSAAVYNVKFLLDCDPNQILIQFEGRPLLEFACRQLYNHSNIGAALEVIKILFDAHPEAIEDNAIVRGLALTHPIQRYNQQVRSFINRELVYARKAKNHRLMMTPDKHGQLPLHKALQNNATLGSIKLLTKANPHAVQSPDNIGALPLHVACQHHDSVNVIQYLIGLDPSSLDAVDRNGNTALHYACLGAKHDTIALLLEKYDAVSVSKRNAENKLPIELLWESDAVKDEESAEYTDCVFRLLKAYPETLRNVGTVEQQALTACSGRNGNGKKSSLLVFIRKAMRSSMKRVQNIRKPASASDGLP